jgi:hypothetical protein
VIQCCLRSVEMSNHLILITKYAESVTKFYFYLNSIVLFLEQPLNLRMLQIRSKGQPWAEQ